MASVMRVGGDAPATDASMLNLNFNRDENALAEFRVRVDVAYDNSLSSLIESEIIPRLMIAHATKDEPVPVPSTTESISAHEIEALAALALKVGADALLQHIETVIARGVPVEAIMVDMLAPGARLLGEYWESDRCDFVDVTMGLWRLQEVVHEIASRIPSNRASAAGGLRALFVSMPGDQHSFGTVVIDEMFRRGGWITDRMCDAQTPDLMRRVAENWFDLVGLTVSCDCHIGTLNSVIATIRNVSRNSRVCVMVGGRIFTENPDLAMQVGADGTAQDASVALTIADRLVRHHVRDAALIG